MRFLLEQGALDGGDGRHNPERARRDRLSAPGHDLDYTLTGTGSELLSRLGVDLPAGRRRPVGYCVDWTEQRHHLAGAAGAGLLARFEELDWVRRGAKRVPRALAVTDIGRQGFAEHFGIDTSRLTEAA